jgi:hypothetical protein
LIAVTDIAASDVSPEVIGTEASAGRNDLESQKGAWVVTSSTHYLIKSPSPIGGLYEKITIAAHHDIKV